MTSCSDVVGYQHFRRPWCLHFQGKVNGTGNGGIEAGREYKRRWSSSGKG